MKPANRSRLFNKKALERHVLQKAKRLQQIAFNGSGKARTKDYLLPVGDVKPCLSEGKGRWKTWGPAAVLRSAFAPSRASSRSGARDAGGSHKHVIDCSHVVSQCVLTRISDAMRRLRAASRRHLAQYQTNKNKHHQQYTTHQLVRLGIQPRQQRLTFFIEAHMFDETKLACKLRRGRVMKYRTVAQHGQMY